MAYRDLLAPALLLALAASAAGARPTLVDEAGRCTITANDYRVSFARDSASMSYELRDAQGGWKPVARTPLDLVTALATADGVLEASRQRATWDLVEGDAYLAVSRRTVLGVTGRSVVGLEYLCADEGLLLACRVLGAGGQGTLWSPPRIGLRPADWDGYAFWSADGRRHEGALSSLQPYPAYAGVSPWGAQGDTVARLDSRHPALLVRATAAGPGLGVVYLDYGGAWQGASGFLQRHTPETLYLYGGFAPAGGEGLRWAWLAPFPLVGRDGRDRPRRGATTAPARRL